MFFNYKLSALFWNASAILSRPNWKDLVIIIFKKSFFNSKSTSNETSVILFSCLKCHLFSKCFNGPSRLVTYIELSFLLNLTSLLYVSTKGPFPIVRSATISIRSPFCFLSCTFAPWQNGTNSGYFSISNTNFIKSSFLHSINLLTEDFAQLQRNRINNH